VNRPSHSANDRSAHYGPARADLFENRDELTHVSNAVFEQAQSRKMGSWPAPPSEEVSKR
jgi:hypothetical protein